MTQQRIGTLELRVDDQATRLRNLGLRLAKQERQRAAELPRIEGLELRVNGQEGRLSRLTLRVATRERQAKVLKAQADEEGTAVHLVKSISFRLNFTVAEMATYFEVNPEAIRAHLYDYVHNMANDQIADYCRSPWPGGVTKIDILSTDLVEIT